MVTSLTDADGRRAERRAPVRGLVVVRPHHQRIADVGAGLDPAPHPDQGVLDVRVVDDAPVGDERALDLALDDLGGRQVPRVGEDRRGRVVEVELGERGAEVEVGLVERADGPDVLPVSLVLEGVHPVGLDDLRDHVLAEVRLGAGQGLLQHRVVEHVDPHRRRQRVGVHRLVQPGHPAPVHPQRGQDLGVRGLFDESRDPAFGVHIHDPESTRRLGAHRGGGDGDLGPARHVALDEGADVHPEELVAREDEHQPVGVIVEMQQVLPYGIGGPLVPLLPVGPLLRGQDLHEARREVVEPIALLDVTMQRAAVELGQDEDAAEIGVEAVADRDVHQPILPPEGNGRLGAVLGEGKETGPRSATQHDADHVLRPDGRGPGGHGVTPPPRARS